MENDLIEKIVLGAPNFVGFVIGLTLLYRRLRHQDEFVRELIRQWSECEDDKERRVLPDK